MRYLLLSLISLSFFGLGCMETGPFLKTETYWTIDNNNRYPQGAEAICHVKKDCIKVAEDFCQEFGVQNYAWDVVYDTYWEWDCHFKQWYKTKLPKINLRFTCEKAN